MFQKRHYEAIARVMQRTKPDENATTQIYVQWRKMRTELCQMFIDTNPRFDSERFQRACE